MTTEMQQQIELSAVLNLIPYMDTRFDDRTVHNLNDIVEYFEEVGETSNDGYKLLKEALKEHKSWGKIELVNQSSTNDTNGPDQWTDDLIQGCTFRDQDGNYYVAFRGTGDGRWPDNGDGMTEESTEMQQAAKEYFDKMAEKYFVDAHANGKQIIVTGHSKGGNEAQYVYMESEYEYLIDHCYNMDGQGFSDVAIEHFKDKYGSAYEDKLKNMYSICGENDPVNELGIKIIPEENTYYVQAWDGGIVSSHLLENMLAEKDPETGEFTYTGVRWFREDGEIIHGEQGPIAIFAKKLSAEMMKMDPENRHGCAVAIMRLIDIIGGNVVLGKYGENIDYTDFFDLIANGSPLILKTLLLTEEGRETRKILAVNALEAIYAKWGVAGVLGLIAIGGVLLLSGILKALIETVVILSAVVALIDFIFDELPRIIGVVTEKIKEFIQNVHAALVDIVNKIGETLRSITPGGWYSANNPHIVVNTGRMNDYAGRLLEANRRLVNLGRRLDSLYWKVGLVGLHKLIYSDMIIGDSQRLRKSASYLTETAKDFVDAESAIQRA